MDSPSGNGYRNGFERVSIDFLDCIAGALNCAELPSDYRHWNLVLFLIILVLGLLLACLTQGWFVPFCQQVNQCAGKCAGKNPMVKETIYTPATPP